MSRINGKINGKSYNISGDNIIISGDTIIVDGEIIEENLEKKDRCDSCGHAKHIGSCPDETYNGYSCRCRK